MGLSITKRFAELLSGTIEVESEVGKGSVFTVRIPVYFGESERELPFSITHQTLTIGEADCTACAVF